MVNKKLFLLIAVGIFLILVFSGIVNSASKNVMRDWRGYPFEYCTDTDNHDVEYCAYHGPSPPQTYSRAHCDESYDQNQVTCLGQGTGCIDAKTNPFNDYRIVYEGYWYNTKCRFGIFGGHDVGTHFANGFNGVVYVDTQYSSTGESSTAICYDYDDDLYYSAVSTLGPIGTTRTVSEVCGNSESSACDNSDGSTYFIYSPGTEICSPNMRDEDCDGYINEENCPTITYYCDVDYDGDISSIPSGYCSSYNCVPSGCSATMGNDCDDTNNLVNPDLNEVCDNIDNNCNNEIDEGNNLHYNDLDGDNYGGAIIAHSICATPSSPGYSGDCNDNDPDIGPNQIEVCDGFDNDCNFFIDDNSCSLGFSCMGSPVSCKKEKYWAMQNKVTGEYSEISNISSNLGVIQEVHPVFSHSMILYSPIEDMKTDWYFDIYEKDAGFCIFGVGFGCPDKIRIDADHLMVDSKISAWQIIENWTITQADINKAKNNDPDDIYEFYFVLHVIDYDYGGSYDLEGPILQVEWLTAPTESCSDGIQNQDETGIDCGGSTCSACSVSPACSDGIQNQDETGIDCGGSTCSACADTCAQYQFCSDYDTEELCAQNSCALEPQNTDCAGSTICGCSWNSATNSCNSYYTDDLGTCAFAETEIQNCENNGFSEYSILASWSSISEPQPANCADGTFGPIACSAKTRLPLENKFGILLTIISIIGIYFLFFKKKKNGE